VGLLIEVDLFFVKISDTIECLRQFEMARNAQQVPAISLPGKNLDPSAESLSWFSTTKGNLIYYYFTIWDVLGLIIITASFKVTVTSSSLGPAVKLVLNKDKFGHPTVDDTFPGNTKHME
jgi:hypothetical protein